jgi:hypothetical protein
MNNKVIAVYLDDSYKMEQELGWLWKTWQLYSLEDEYDLVVYYNPVAKKRLERFKGIIPIEMPYVRMSDDYKFLNSHYFCMSEYNEYLTKYDYIMKTDCDVFLTEHMKGYTPTKMLIGQGGYYDSDDQIKIDYVKKIAKDYKLKYRNMVLIGASMFGKTESLLPTVSNQAVLTEEILKRYSITEEFKEVGFDFGISSMIAGEIIINHSFCEQHVILYSLDSLCWEWTKIGNNVLHIHAWHSAINWSKHKYFKGEYDDKKVEFKDAFKNAANYCHFIATLSDKDLYKYKEMYKKGELEIDYDL